MIGKRGVALAALTVAAMVLLGSCELVMSLLNKPPTVSLSSTTLQDNDKAWSAETIRLSATARDPDGDKLTYQWYLDDTLQPNATEKDVVLTAPMVTSVRKLRLKVTVSDGKDERSASLEISVQPSGTLIIRNDSSSTLSQFYFVAHPDGANNSWGSNFLSGGPLASGSYMKILGITGTRNLRWVYSSGTRYQITSEEGFQYGTQRTLRLSDNRLLVASTSMSSLATMANALEEEASAGLER